MNGEEARQRLLAAIPLAQRRLQLAGVSTAVLEGGDGPPVVLLHGPGEFAGKWMRVIPDLMTTHRMIAPDLPGHGTSEVTDGPLDSDRVLAWLGKLIDRTCISPPALVGHGLDLAARFALDHGDRLSRLVMVDTLGLAPFEPAPEFEVALNAFAAEPAEDTYDALWRRCVFHLDRLREQMGESWELFRAYNIDRARSPSVQAALHVLVEDMGAAVIPPADLARIAVPTTLIWGRHDLATPLRIAEDASARYGWSLQVIDNAADDPPIEQPEAFLAALRPALETLPRTPRVTTNRAEQFDTVIIGAGQAGLSVAYNLARRGLPFVILDVNERIGDSWRKRWDSLRLFTPARYDGLPGLRFPGPTWSFPSKDEVADFIEAYAQRFDLPVRTGVRVDRLAREGDRYVMASGNDHFHANNVVVASGAFRTPRIPAFAAELDPGIVQLHSSAYRNPSQLREGGVLVVGAGNSGAELALEASRSDHQTWLSGRDTGEEAPFRIGSLPDRLLTPPLWFLFSRLLTTTTRAGRKLRQKVLTMGAPLVRVKRKDIAAAGIARAPRMTGVRDGYPMLEDGRVMDVSNVIWCTGFRPDFGWIDLPIFDADGQPEHERGVVESPPGLYFVGLFFLSSLTSSLVGGVGRDAEHIAKHIASRQPNRRPTTPVIARARQADAGVGQRATR